VISKQEFESAKTTQAQKDIAEILQKINRSLELGSTSVKLGKNYSTPWPIIEAAIQKEVSKKGWILAVSTYATTEGSPWDRYTVVYKEIGLI
jgi:hypothetical protein